MNFGDIATVLRLLTANQRQLVEMLRLIDPRPGAHYDRYEAMLARLAKVDDLLSWERGTTAPADDPHAEADDGGVNEGRRP